MWENQGGWGLPWLLSGEGIAEECTTFTAEFTDFAIVAEFCEG
jgi:hypothetical protein